MRRKEIDLARGFTVFIMTPVHAVLIYSRPEVFKSWLGQVLGFLAEGPGAPLFMMLMGISFVFSRKHNIMVTLKRSLLLLGLAYLLNFLKFVVPLWWGILPQRLLSDHGISNDNAAYGELFLVGDILQLAAISLAVLALLFKSRKYALWAAIAVPLVLLGTPLLYTIISLVPPINYVCHLFFGNGSNVYFPVFPWLAYPLAGLSLGFFIFRTKNPYPGIAIAGFLLLLGARFMTLCPSLVSQDFYRPGAAQVVHTIGFDMLWLTGCRIVVLLVPENIFFRLLYWLSRHITFVYILQWVLVCWCIPFFGYSRLAIGDSLISVFLLTPVVFIIAAVSIKYLPGNQSPRYAAENL